MTSGRASRRSRTVGLATLLLCCALGVRDPALAQVGPVEDGRMPVASLHEQVLDLSGDPARPVSLEVTLMMPSGPGPFPLAVMNHGATNASGANRGDRYHLTISAYYFLSRGYAVALPMMRGFAGSGGSIVHAGCALDAVAASNARDIDAVIEAVARRPEVDRTRIVVAGQSFGGWNALGVGIDPPAGVRGLVLFNAALRASDCPRQDDALVEGAARLGARTRVPSLWFYGDNDSVMPNETWRAVYTRYSQAGASADLYDIGRWGADSHQMLSDPASLPRWSAQVDTFLTRIGLPSKVVDPDYLPHPVPPATNFAPLADVGAVPHLSETGQAVYRRFLGDKMPRAFVLGPTGAVSLFSGGYDPLGFALRACGRAGVACQPYAVNDKVVWTGSPAAGGSAPVRLVSRTVHADATSSLGTFFAVNPDCTSRGPPQVRLTALPAHGTVAVAPRDAHPAFPPGSPYAACNGATVSATGVAYTPALGYAGLDAVEIDKVTPDGRHESIRITLTVAR